MQSLVLLLLLVAVASAVYVRSPYSYYGRHAVYSGLHRPYARTYSHHGVYRTSPYAYHGLYRGKREAEAEPEAEAEAEAEAEPGTYVYNTSPYVFNPHYAPYSYLPVKPTTVKVKSTIPATYHYAPTYLPYAGHYSPYGLNPYTFSPYHHQYVVKPVESNEADEPAAATSDDEAVEVSRKKREAEAEAEPEADPAKVVTHHYSPYLHKTYTTAHHVPAYTVPAYTTYSGLPHGFPYHGAYPYKAYNRYYY